MAETSCVILIDDSNLFIGGQKHSAKVKGVKPRGDRDEPPSDPSWRLDFDALREVMADGRRVHTALIVASSPGEESETWTAAEKSGFQVVVRKREEHEGEKAVDTEIVARGAEIIATAGKPMTLALGSGDLDYLPLVDLAHRHGWEVELCTFSSTFDASGKIAKAVDRVRPLDDVFERISRYEFDWPGK